MYVDSRYATLNGSYGRSGSYRSLVIREKAHVTLAHSWNPWWTMHRHHPRSRVQLTLSVLRMDRALAGRDRERHKRSAGRPGGRLTGRLFSGLANWFPAARLDYANRTCVLAFDWSARILTQRDIYTRTHARNTHADDARGPCVYHCTVLTHTIAEANAHGYASTRRARLTLRIRILMSPVYTVYVYVRTCVGILDHEHLLMPSRPPANRASFNARNGISQVFRRDRVSC